jgi:hypothetical protein
MKKFEKHIRALNAILYAETFDEAAFIWQLMIIRELGRTGVVVYDFAYHNDALRQEAGRKKLEALQSRHYKEAADYRDLEMTCEKFLAFRKDYPQEQSMFELIGSIPTYLHFGTATNDKEVLELLKTLLQNCEPSKSGTKTSR